jgi:hypothetical protein
MLYRFNRVFNVSKTRAAVVAVLCTLGAIPFLCNANLAVIGGAFLCYAFIYGCIWFYKFNRDRKIIERAQVGAQQAPVAPVIEMTSPGSSRLRVPPPLDRP